MANGGAEGGGGGGDDCGDGGGSGGGDGGGTGDGGDEGVGEGRATGGRVRVGMVESGLGQGGQKVNDAGCPADRSRTDHPRVAGDKKHG